MQTMGQKFKVAREKKRVSLSQAALKTRIKIQHLEAMERDDFSKMPAPIYARGFIRNYCDFLGLDPAPMLVEYNENHGGAKRPSIPVDAKIIKNVPGEEPLPTGRLPDDAVMREDSARAEAGPGDARPPASPIDLRVFAIGGAIVAVLLVLIAVIKFWPARQVGNGSNVVEVSRPAVRSPLAVMREPPEPYIETTSQGVRPP